MQIDTVAVTQRIVDFMRVKLDEYRRDGVIIGMSGGIDSALVASLLVKALGPSKILALILPERDSHPQSRRDALVEIQRLGIQYRVVKMKPVLKKIGVYENMPLQILVFRRLKELVVRRELARRSKVIGEEPFKAGLLGTRDLGKQQSMIDKSLAYIRVKHRARMVFLYYYAELENRLVVGTTNRSEALTGYVVKWGDNVADIEPILPLYKTQVYQLAEYLHVSKAIIHKPPSPDLLPGIVDEAALGITYASLDKILWGFDQDWDEEHIREEFKVTVEQIEHVRGLVEASEHLRTLPPFPDLG
jgi:NAD+ synthase